ncbi:MAG: hypothetical protein GT589_03680 [Peptoclostridium sp.]|uniref:hypothetical protein n=1 Tax=Peptoclostridium sp. TaxID=1904860 RepID=UPI00139C223B|nr:hypothetical protein [Peptoclostridium sp.]MZQ75241.1 hypothetical protein [Peptoclostridium sp.]
MEKKTKTIIKDVFIANDGTEFYNEDDCLCYEEEKKQENLEREIEERLGIKTQANFPAMLNNRYKHEYKLFLIRNEKDLDFFVKTYEYWFTQLENYHQVDKETFVYPDVLCILDFPTGGEEHRLYRMSQLCNQFNAFIDEVSSVVNEKME